MSLEEIVNISVQWGPTVLVFLIMLFSFIVGLFRGFRKSTILAVNALIAFGLVVVVYIWLVTNPKVDEYVVTYANQILANMGQSSIQEMLQASESSTSLKEILTEILPTYMDLGEGVSAVIKENGAYLGALVNSAYRLVFAVVSLVVYYVLIFIFYIFYLIFIPERRYKRRKHKRYIACKGEEYKKRRLLGGLVGSLRGVVASIVCLSFLGALLFIVTGSDGTTKNDDVKFGDETIDEYYDIYEAISEYGNHGIYSLLNAFKDKNDVPYYLFAADLVLSGSYEDRENNVSAEIVYRKELAGYIKFVRSTAELLVKYGADDLTPFLNGEEGDVTVALSNTFAKEGFKTEFEAIIDEFEEDTFFINFALSAVNSIAKNINDFTFTESLDPQIVDILNILFVGEEDEVITISNIVNKEDAKLLLSSVITIMAQNDISAALNDTEQALSIVKDLLPQITKLSIFTDEKKVEKGNKVLSKVYDYVIESLANDNTEEIKDVITSNEIMKLTNKTVTEINWMKELAELINIGTDVLTLYQNNYDEEDPVSGLLHMLDETNPNKDVNKSSLDNVIDALSKSEILGLALSTSYINDMLTNALSSISEEFNFILPEQVDYVRKYNSDGSVKVEGEIYTLLKSVEILLENDFASFYDDLSKGEFTGDTEQILELADILLKDVELDGKTTSVVDNLLNSKLLKYTLSQVLTSLDIEGISIVIPEECHEDVPEDIIVIQNEKLKSIVSSISLILPEEGEELININKIYENKDQILANEILHATVINLLVDKLEEAAADTLVIPDEYKVTKDDLIYNYSTNIWITTSEVSNILDALNAVVDLSTLDIENIEAAFTNLNISKTSVEVALKSEILYLTVSTIVNDTLSQNEITVPEEAKEGEYITKVEITNLVGALEAVLGTEDGIDINNIDLENIRISKSKVSEALESIILHSAVSKIVTDTLSQNEITVPEEAKEGSYITKVEITNLVGSLEVVLGTDEDGIDINNIDLENIRISKSKVSEALESIILHSAVSKIVTDTLSQNEITVPEEAKEGEYITKVEITNLVGSLEVVLGTDEDGIDINNIDLENIKISKSKVSTILESIILHSAVSKIVTETMTENEIEVPEEAKEGSYITKVEITNLVSSLEVILNTGDDGIDINDINLDNITINQTKVSTILESIILHLEISKTVTNTLTENEITIPVEAKEGNYITKTEIINLIGGLEVVLGTDEDGIDINNIDLENIRISKSKVSEALESIILHSAVSKLVTDSLTENNIVVPEEAKEGDYITKAEITNLVGSLEVILNTGDNGIDIDAINLDNITINQAKVTTILESIILHLEVSSVISETLADNEMIIPEEAKEGNYITKVEITKLISSLEIVLGTSEEGIDINNINFDDIKISKTTVTDALDSMILHSAVSKLVTDSLTDSDITIPQEVKDDTRITKVEIISLVSALEVILGTESGIEINNFNIENITLSSSDIDVLFESKIIQRKVTVEVNKAFDKPLVNQIYVNSNRKDILKDEAKKLLCALEAILPSSEDGINFSDIDMANIEITSGKVEVAYTSTIFAQIISDNILNNNSIAGNIPTTALSAIEYTIPNTTGEGVLPVAIISKEEVSNLIKAIETLFNKPLSADTTFDINEAKVSYGNGGLGNLMTILSSKIVECMISDTIISTLGNIPTTCLTEVSIYNSSTKANIIDKNELGVLVQIIGSKNISENTYELSVGEQMEFNNFDRTKINFIKESEIGRYKVSEILLSSPQLVIPTQCLENIGCLGLPGGVNVFTTVEFKNFLDALNSVIPAENGFDNISLQMPATKEEYSIVAQSDVLRATITNKIEINGSAIFLDGDLDVTSYTDGINNIPVLTKDELIKALIAIEAINGSSSSEFEASISIATLATFNEEMLDAVLNFNMLRYQTSELMKSIPFASSFESENIYTYSIINTSEGKVVEKSTETIKVFTANGIKQFIEFYKGLI